jgi:hypothetical protein
MMENRNDRNGSGFELKHFEKNRYFQGKLMTARDMLTDQQYHANRLETITKLTNGTGIVSGLTISEFTEEEGQLRLELQPGDEDRLVGSR